MKLMGPELTLSARLHRFGIFAASRFSRPCSRSSSGPARRRRPAHRCAGRGDPRRPSCPTNCQAVGKTTGFQTNITGAKSPFVVTVPRARGRLVDQDRRAEHQAEPEQQQPERLRLLQQDLRRLAEGEDRGPQADHEAARRGKPIYKLKSQSPVEDLSGLPGADHHLHPRHSAAGQAQQRRGADRPDLGACVCDQPERQHPLAGRRKKGKCNDTADILAGTPQDALGSMRAYGCSYNTARLLYSATVVADPNQAPAKPPAKKPKK